MDKKGVNIHMLFKPKTRQIHPPKSQFTQSKYPQLTSVITVLKLVDWSPHLTCIFNHKTEPKTAIF